MLNLYRLLGTYDRCYCASVCIKHCRYTIYHNCAHARFYTVGWCIIFVWQSFTLYSLASYDTCCTDSSICDGGDTFCTRCVALAVNRHTFKKWLSRWHWWTLLTTAGTLLFSFIVHCIAPPHPLQERLLLLLQKATVRLVFFIAMMIMHVEKALLEISQGNVICVPSPDIVRPWAWVASNVRPYVASSLGVILGCQCDFRLAKSLTPCSAQLTSRLTSWKSQFS